MHNLLVTPAVPQAIAQRLKNEFDQQEFNEVDVLFEDKSLPFGESTIVAFSHVDAETAASARDWYETKLAQLGYRAGLT
ncbi:hypothetical protein ACFFLM_00195 [Deinococcus oregonensis]|uniref:Uncharacterized protein n=1 Tax=Deinococcus oregonensis TaxID=1805970 RepID=A0ABV6AUW8_9DEIO